MVQGLWILGIADEGAAAIRAENLDDTPDLQIRRAEWLGVGEGRRKAHLKLEIESREAANSLITNRVAVN